ncbi:hypothetical protein O181_081177 [Austropuccinia psidii MF-1]|uniref:Uncharacterized protein n=1 Tax=Austropuccinia psidii MF-1 TaxID=1389203 RepID=A0A9Q3FN32_9BASI|nr:hypothetical protein [Austropuccinia psidii MF-1]
MLSNSSTTTFSPLRIPSAETPPKPQKQPTPGRELTREERKIARRRNGPMDVLPTYEGKRLTFTLPSAVPSKPDLGNVQSDIIPLGSPPQITSTSSHSILTQSDSYQQGLTILQSASSSTPSSHPRNHQINKINSKNPQPKENNPKNIAKHSKKSTSFTNLQNPIPSHSSQSCNPKQKSALKSLPNTILQRAKIFPVGTPAIATSLLTLESPSKLVIPSSLTQTTHNPVQSVSKNPSKDNVTHHDYSLITMSGQSDTLANHHDLGNSPLKKKPSATKATLVQSKKLQVSSSQNLHPIPPPQALSTQDITSGPSESLICQPACFEDHPPSPISPNTSQDSATNNSSSLNSSTPHLQPLRDTSNLPISTQVKPSLKHSRTTSGSLKSKPNSRVQPAPPLSHSSNVELFLSQSKENKLKRSNTNNFSSQAKKTKKPISNPDLSFTPPDYDNHSKPIPRSVDSPAKPASTANPLETNPDLENPQSDDSSSQTVLTIPQRLSSETNDMNRMKKLAARVFTPNAHIQQSSSSNSSANQRTVSAKQLLPTEPFLTEEQQLYIVADRFVYESETEDDKISTEVQKMRVKIKSQLNPPDVIWISIRKLIQDEIQNLDLTGPDGEREREILQVVHDRFRRHMLEYAEELVKYGLLKLKLQLLNAKDKEIQENMKNLKVKDVALTTKVEDSSKDSNNINLPKALKRNLKLDSNDHRARKLNKKKSPKNNSKGKRTISQSKAK